MSASPWRFRVGAAIFVVGFSSPLLIPVVVASDLPPEIKTALSGLLAAGIPELFSLVAVAILGKEGFARLKEIALRFLKRHGPPERVSRTRYRTGTAMFVVAVLYGWASPYVSHILSFVDANSLAVAAGGDLLLVTSLFALGGEFWDKLRALFHHGAKAVFP